MSFDLAALADRFRRAGEWPLVPPPTAAPTPTPPEGPWLTAEAFMPPEDPPVTGHGGGLQSNTPAEAPNRQHVNDSPPRRASTRRPKRRRWTMPTSPADRQTEPVDPPPAQLHRCPHCGERHQPVRLEAGGVFASYARQLVAEPGQRRPRPLGQTGDTTALVRDAFNPWRAHPAAEPPPPGTTLRERIAHLWYGDES